MKCRKVRRRTATAAQPPSPPTAELNGRGCGSADAIAGPLTWSNLGWISEQKESGGCRSPSSYFCRASAAATKP